MGPGQCRRSQPLKGFKDSLASLKSNVSDKLLEVFGVRKFHKSVQIHGVFCLGFGMVLNPVKFWKGLWLL